MKRRNPVKIDDAKYYERIWAKEEWVRHGHKFDNVRLRALIRDVKPGDRVLDVGAGVFGAAQFIVEHRPDLATVDLVAFDQSYTARDIVEQTTRRIRWIIGDAERPLPFQDREFDVVISGETIEHMEDPARFAAELMRVGKHGAVSTLDHECEQAKAREYPEHLFEFNEVDLLRLFPGGIYALVGNYHVLYWRRS